MKAAMLVDVFEPSEVLDGINQCIGAVKFPLNSKGLLDYWWRADDWRITIERKASDLVGSIADGSLVDRLRMAIINKGCDEVALLCEGVWVPIGVTTQYFHQSKDGRFFIPGKVYKIPYAFIQHTLYELDKSGVTVYHTNNLAGTIVTLVSLYNGSFEDSSKVLNRYRKPKPVVQERNPYVEQLMSIPGVGEKLAKELVGVYGTPFDVYSLSEEQLTQTAGVGKRLAKEILTRVGRI